MLSFLLVCLLVWTTPLSALAEGESESVKVSFTLLGDTVHDSESDGQIHTYYGGGLQTWLQTDYEIDMDAYQNKGLSVKDLLFEVLRSNRMMCEANSQGNYVSAITNWDGTRLAEHTNGFYSGWMVVVNDERINVSIDQYKLKDGDSVVFHYTDDYRKDKPHTHEWAHEWSYDSMNHWHECSGSGAACSAKQNSQKDSFGAHTGSWVTTRGATCTADGIETYCCSTCGYSASRIIPHTGHKLSAWEQITPSTVFTAEVHKRTCSACSYSEEKTVSERITPVLELPGNLTALSIKKGATVRFTLTMAATDSVDSVVSNNAKYVKVASWQKTGAVSLKGVAKGKTSITVKLASGKTRTYTVNVVTGTVKTTRVTVANTKLTLAKNKTTTLKPVLTPFTSTQKITYKTSNKKIASVTAAGKVKAVAPGTAKITVTSGSKKAVVTVTVPGITLAKTSVTVKKNKTLTLKPKLYGVSGTVTYTSSNQKVAKVAANGKITGIKKGTATITIKAGAYALKCKVKVK